jgi:17beta-estradiol 17-dehydrogenase / very-long-chain 3-oxoacyl-CoA reductase
MTKLLLPKMLEKKRGIVVNISSSAGTMNMPMHIVYSATKVSTLANLIN